MVEVTLNSHPLTTVIGSSIHMPLFVFGIVWVAAARSSLSPARKRLIAVAALLATVGVGVLASYRLDPMTSVSVDGDAITLRYFRRSEERLPLNEVQQVSEEFRRSMVVAVHFHSGRTQDIFAEEDARRTLADAIGQAAGLRRVGDKEWTR